MVTRAQLDKLSQRIDAVAAAVEAGRGVARVVQWVHTDDAEAMATYFAGSPAEHRGQPRPDFRIESEAEVIARHMAANPQDVGKRVEIGIACRWMTRTEAAARGWA